jgi:hypothetical protein
VIAERAQSAKSDFPAASRAGLQSSALGQRGFETCARVLAKGESAESRSEPVIGLGDSPCARMDVEAGTIKRRWFNLRAACRSSRDCQKTRGKRFEFARHLVPDAMLVTSAGRQRSSRLHCKLKTTNSQLLKKSHQRSVGRANGRSRVEYLDSDGPQSALASMEVVLS